MEWKIHVNCLADDEAPTLICVNATSNTDSGLNSSSTVVLNPTASDNVDMDLQVTCSHTSNDTFHVGQTIVNCSSTDVAGNTGTCFLFVTVTGKKIKLFILILINHSLGSRYCIVIFVTSGNEITLCDHSKKWKV